MRLAECAVSDAMVAVYISVECEVSEGLGIAGARVRSSREVVSVVAAMQELIQSVVRGSKKLFWIVFSWHFRRVGVLTASPTPPPILTRTCAMCSLVWTTIGWQAFLHMFPKACQPPACNTGSKNQKCLV